MAGRGEPVLVAMSGGVDSSVVAAILRKRGYAVVGVTLQIWQESQSDPRHNGCCSLGAVEDARRVARLLDIPHYVLNYKERFRETVIENFIEEYSSGRTPNPCVQCNRKVKFDSLMQTMEELGCSRLATGHYSRIRRRNGRYCLLRSRGGKDQSYVLYMLGQEQLSRVMFPLGELPGKDDTRQIAREFGLPVADKADSQEICFVSESGGYQEFLRKARPEAFQEGEMVDTAGRVIGQHGGAAGFTVGQRRGLGVARGRPLYVLKLEPEANRVVVGTDEELMQREVTLTEIAWSQPVARPMRVDAKIRYNMSAQRATLVPGDSTKIIFDEPVRAVTPGQIAVAYRGATVVAGGVICPSKS